MNYGFDFDIFYRAALALLQGESAYRVGGFFSPHPLAVLLVPLALLPFGVSYALWTGIKLILLWKTGDRMQFVRALLFFPVAFDLLQGQVDLLIFLVLLQRDWLGVALATLRPQMAIWVIPFYAYRWWKERAYDRFGKSLAVVLALFGVSTWVEPDWWSKWLNAPGVAWAYNRQSASLYGLAQIVPLPHAVVFAVISITAAVTFLVLRPRSERAYWQWVALFNPVANIYSLSILFKQVDWVVVVLGFAALPLSVLSGTNAVWALIPLYLIFKDHFLHRDSLS